jgi:hypothetical protein
MHRYAAVPRPLLFTGKIQQAGGILPGRNNQRFAAPHKKLWSPFRDHAFAVNDSISRRRHPVCCTAAPAAFAGKMQQTSTRLSPGSGPWLIAAQHG